MKRIPIAITSFNNKSFCIYQEDDSIKYANYNKGLLTFDVSENEISFLDMIYNFIKYDPKHGVFCKSLTLNNEKINIYQDTRNNLYSFLKVENGKEVNPSKSDLLFLNNYYNGSREVFYDLSEFKDYINKTKKDFKEHKEEIIRYYKIQGIICLLLISSYITYISLPKSVRADLDYNVGLVTYDDLTKENKNYTWDDVASAIDENENISDEEKKFIKNLLKAEYEENKEYMNIELIIDNLKSLKVEYISEYIYDEKKNDYIDNPKYLKNSDSQAYYSKKDNTISVREKEVSNFDKTKYKKISFKDTKEEVYFHELNHALTNHTIDSFSRNFTDHSSTGYYQNNGINEIYATDIYSESINEIFTQEYIAEYNGNLLSTNYSRFGYTNIVHYMYALAEILPPEVLREYKFNDNDSIITNGLLEICDDKEFVYNFTTSLKSINIKYDSLFPDYSKNQLKNNKAIHDGFERLYKEKYGKEMKDDMNMLIYLYNTPVLTKEEKNIVNNFLNFESIDGVNRKIFYTPKGYFSNFCIENNPYIRVYDNDYNIIVIDEDNRYIESSTNSIKHV